MQYLVLTRRRMDQFPPTAWTPELGELESQQDRTLYAAGSIRKDGCSTITSREFSAFDFRAPALLHLNLDRYRNRAHIAVAATNRPKARPIQMPKPFMCRPNARPMHTGKPASQ